MLACSIMLYKSSGAFKRARLCRVSLQWSRNKGKVEWLSSRSLTSFKHRYTRLDLSNRVQWALHKVFKRTRLCRVYKSNVVWYTKSSASEQAFTYPGPRGFLVFFIGKFCDANLFFYFFFLPARSAESREKKASGLDRWEPHFHAISFWPSFLIGGYF